MAHIYIPLCTPHLENTHLERCFSLPRAQPPQQDGEEQGFGSGVWGSARRTVYTDVYNVSFVLE